MILCLMSWALFLQDDSNVQVDESLAVDYIVLDVIARNADGTPATNLTVEDFVVRDQRKTMEIEHFEILDFRPKDSTGVVVRSSDESEALESPALDPIEQTLIVVLDLGAADRTTIDRSIEQLESFFAELSAERRLQIFLFSMDIGMISRGFSTNPKEVVDDVVIFESRLAGVLEEHHQNLRQGNLATYEKEVSDCFPISQSDSQRFAAGGGPTDMVEPCIENAFKRFIIGQEGRSRRVLTTLEKFVGFLAAVPGLKSVYVVSPGFSRVPGEAAADLARSYANLKTERQSNQGLGSPTAVDASSNVRGQEGVFTASHFQIPVVNNYQGAKFEVEYQRLTHLALLNRIVIHTLKLADPRQAATSGRASLTNLDAQSVRTKRIYFTFQNELEKGLSFLAESTGGSHMQTSNLSDALNEAIDRDTFYYVMAYPKPKSRRKGFRKIRLDCKRPGVTLQYRNGYYPVLPASK
jgi:VWFA-related protein